MVVSQILRTAIYAGTLAGLALGVMLMAFMAPIILQAETFEAPGRVSSFSELLQRDSLTLLGAVTLALAYGFLVTLAGKFFFKNLSIVKKGTLLGLGGFLLFYGIPALGQPPILPGMESCSPVTLRQLWYLEVMIFASVALGTYYLATQWIKSRWLVVAIALLLLAIPFVTGIPNSLEGNRLPGQLILQFRIASFGINLVFWVLLGLLASYFSQRFSEKTR